MKLRFYKDSIRVRLSADDVQLLQEAGVVSQTTHFGPGSLIVCQLQSSSEVAGIRVSLENSELLVEMPQARVHRWANSEEVGMSGTQDAGDGRELEILIEKDFECLHQDVNEPGVRLFPNPRRV